MKQVLIYGISGNIGGIESFIYNIISQIHGEEIRFDILTFYEKIEYQEIYNKIGVNIFTVTSKHKNPIKNKIEMRGFFEKYGKNYDVIWCNLAELINIDVLKYAKKNGIEKRIIHSHSTGSTRGKILTCLHMYNRTKIKNIATDFWACSKLAGNWFFDKTILESEKFQIVRNAIEVDKYRFDEKIRNEIRKALEVEDAFVIGHVGRMSIVEKNTLFIVEIFNEIVKRIPNAKLVMIGDGQDRKLVEDKIDSLGIRENTKLLGFRKDVEKILNAMDVFLLPSKAEGFGIVLVEAQVNGLQCFTSDFVVPKEVAVTDRVHFVRLDKSAIEWAEIIIKLRDRKRKSYVQEVKDAGYDIADEMKRIKRKLIK